MGLRGKIQFYKKNAKNVQTFAFLEFWKPPLPPPAGPLATPCRPPEIMPEIKESLVILDPPTVKLPKLFGWTCKKGLASCASNTPPKGISIFFKEKLQKGHLVHLVVQRLFAKTVFWIFFEFRKIQGNSHKIGGKGRWGVRPLHSAKDPLSRKPGGGVCLSQRADLQPAVGRRLNQCCTMGISWVPCPPLWKLLLFYYFLFTVETSWEVRTPLFFWSAFGLARLFGGS